MSSTDGINATIPTEDENPYVEPITTSTSSVHANTESLSISSPNIESIDDTQNNTFESNTITPVVGDHVEVFWPTDNAYYPGVITELTSDGKHVVLYDEADVETLNFDSEQWRFDSSQNANIGSITVLPSSEQSILMQMFNVFGNRTFMKHHIQAFDQHDVENAYEMEEVDFLKNDKIFSRLSVLKGSNVISSHLIYKIKVKDDVWDV